MSWEDGLWVVSDAILKWPVVALVLIGGFLIGFRKEVAAALTEFAAFVRRLKTLKWPGGGATAGEPTEQAPVRKDASAAESETEPEKWVRDHPREAIGEYMRVSKECFFERAFNIIYGTQRALLEYLSKLGDRGEKYVNLTPFYIQFFALSHSTVTDMGSYVGWLHGSGFVEYSGQGADLTVKITPAGADFVSYINSRYRSTYRPF